MLIKKLEKYIKNYKDFLISHQRKDILKYYRYCSKILDIGSGKGFFQGLDPARIIGIERNFDYAQLCHKLGFKVIVGDGRKLPFTNDSFDGVCCSHLIEHYELKDVIKIFNEIYRVLKPGGIAVIISPLPSNNFWNDPTHVRPYPPGAIQAIFSPSEVHQISIDNKNLLKFEIVEIFLKRTNFPLGWSKISPKYLKKFKILHALRNTISILLYGLGIRHFKASEYTCVLRKSTGYLNE